MTKYFKKIHIALAVAAALAVGNASTVLAAGKKSGVNYEHIINLAGMQRMITQQLSKEVILVAMGYEREEHVKQLKSSHALFDRTLNGLREGDVALQLPATDNKNLHPEPMSN